MALSKLKKFVTEEVMDKKIMKMNITMLIKQ